MLRKLIKYDVENILIHLIATINIYIALEMLSKSNKLVLKFIKQCIPSCSKFV